MNATEMAIMQVAVDYPQRNQAVAWGPDAAVDAVAEVQAGPRWQELVPQGQSPEAWLQEYHDAYRDEWDRLAYGELFGKKA